MQVGEVHLPLGDAEIILVIDGKGMFLHLPCLGALAYDLVSLGIYTARFHFPLIGLDVPHCGNHT